MLRFVFMKHITMVSWLVILLVDKSIRFDIPRPDTETTAQHEQKIKREIVLDCM
jgi:hypothetical protein